MAIDIEAWKKTRTRVGVQEACQKPEVMGRKNAGVATVEQTDHLHCHCTICGHTYQAECEANSFENKGGCDCCSSTCT